MQYRITTRIQGEVHPAHAIVTGRVALMRELNFAEETGRAVLNVEERISAGGAWTKHIVVRGPTKLFEIRYRNYQRRIYTVTVEDFDDMAAQMQVMLKFAVEEIVSCVELPLKSTEQVTREFNADIFGK